MQKRRLGALVLILLAGCGTREAAPPTITAVTAPSSTATLPAAATPTLMGPAPTTAPPPEPEPTAAPPIAAIPAPSMISAQPIIANPAVLVIWGSAEGASAYRLYRSPAERESWTLLTTIGVNSPASSYAISDTMGMAGTVYRYAVAGLDAGGAEGPRATTEPVTYP